LNLIRGSGLRNLSRASMSQAPLPQAPRLDASVFNHRLVVGHGDYFNISSAVSCYWLRSIIRRTLVDQVDQHPICRSRCQIFSSIGQPSIESFFCQTHGSSHSGRTSRDT